MKKLLALLFCLTLLCMPLTACESTGTEAEPEKEVEEVDAEEEVSEEEQITVVDAEKLQEAGDTLEARLSLLTEDGWIENDGAYVYTSSDDDCKGEYVITASENDADVKVTFDYGDDNAEMVDFYNGDPDVAKAVCGYWYLRAVAVLDAPEANVTYSLVVGDTEVANGSLTYAEAEEAYNGYYED